MRKFVCVDQRNYLDINEAYTQIISEDSTIITAKVSEIGNLPFNGDVWYRVTFEILRRRD